MRRKRETAKELDQWILIFQCYAEFLRYHFYNRPPFCEPFSEGVNRFIKIRGFPLLMGIYPQYASIEVKIRSFLEKEYQNIIKEYSEKFKNGDTKGIGIIIDALGIDAFDEEWFIEGMKNLFLAGKKFEIPCFEPTRADYRPSLKKISEIEKRAKRNSLSYAFGYYENPATMKTRYHRKFLKEWETFRIHYLYHLLHKVYRKYVLAEIQSYTSIQIFKKHISKVEKVLS